VSGSTLAPDAAARLADCWHSTVVADPPLGEHQAVVTDARPDASQSGHAMIVCSLKSADGRFVLPALFLSLNPKARRLLEETLRALGMTLPSSGRVKVSARGLIDRRLRVVVEADKSGRLRSRVA
jgi:hypothetical protein